MPIINCPECNERISTTAKQCVHCGATITVCPECGGAYAKHEEICPECGYSFSTEATDEKHAEKPPSTSRLFTAGEIRESWIQESPYRKIYKTKLLPWMLLGLFYALLIILAVRVSELPELIEKLKLEEFAEASARIKKMITWIAVSFFVWLVSGNRKDFEIYDFSLWLKSKKHCLPDILRQTLSLDFKHMPNDALKRESAAAERLLEYEIYSKNLPERNGRIADLVSELLFKVLFSVSTYYFLLTWFEERQRFYMGLTNAEPGFGDIWSKFWGNYTALFCALIAVFIIGCVIVPPDKNMKKKKLEWIEKNIPDEKEKYEIYIQNVDSYLINR